MARQAEWLQSRAMLSSVSFDSGSYQLDISLTGSDHVAVEVVNDQVEVSINGTPNGPTPNTFEVFFINVTGGEGPNRIDLSSLHAADFNYLLMSTNINGGDGNDTILGSGVMDYIYGEGDNDSVEGGAGLDNIWGGENDDILWSGSGVSDGDPEIDGGCGVDTVDGIVDASDECGGDDSPGGGSAPVITAPGNQTSIEFESPSMQITATDADLPSDTLTYSANGLPTGLMIDPMTGLISGQIDRDAFENGPVYPVTVTVTDSANLTAAATFNWTVTNAGPASVTATEYLNATTALPNSVTSTGVNPVEQLYIENGHMFELKLNGPIAVPSGLALSDIRYRIGNSATAPTGTFGPAAAATPTFTPSFPSSGVYTIVYVGVDLDKNGSISADEETQKLEIRRLDFPDEDENGNSPLIVMAQRVAPVALKENLFPVKEGEMFETGGLITSIGVPVPSQFRFELTGPNMGDSSLIRWELRRPDTTIKLAGNGNSFLVTFGTPEPLQVRFFLDRNNNTNKDASEPEIVSATFNVVAPVTHSLSFEFSSILIANPQLPLGTPAQRLAFAQSVLDSEDNVLHVKENSADWRTPVLFSLAPSSAGGVFIANAARPDKDSWYDSNLHIAGGHDLTFTFWQTYAYVGYFSGWKGAHGVTGSTGSVVVLDSPALTTIHEIGHLYGSAHTAGSLSYDGFLMHPGSPDTGPSVGDVGGVLRKDDATKFYDGNKI